MKIYIALTGAVLLALSGCTSPRISKNLASGQIGCLPNEISIANEAAGIEGTHSWMASCHGKQYVCSYHSTTGARCTPRQQDVAIAAVGATASVSPEVRTGPVPWYQTPVRDDPPAK